MHWDALMRLPGGICYPMPASKAEMRWGALMMLPGGICYPAAVGWVSKCPVELLNILLWMVLQEGFVLHLWLKGHWELWGLWLDPVW